MTGHRVAHRIASTRRVMRSCRTRRAGARTVLARELATVRSQAELAELAAVLDRHGDAEADPIRAVVDWTRAA
jgi:hypothetical protein